MKNVIKVLALSLVMVMMLGLLVSCGNVSESYAKKINKAAEKDDHYTYEEVMKDLGDEAIDFTYGGDDHASGVVVAIKGVESEEDLEEKLEKEETLKGIIITFLNGKATAAKYGEIDGDDF